MEGLPITDSNLRRDDLHLWLWLIGIAWDIATFVLVTVFYLMLKCHIREQVISFNPRVDSILKAVTTYSEFCRLVSFC